MSTQLPHLSVHITANDLVRRLHPLVTLEQAEAIMRALDSHDDLLAALKRIRLRAETDPTNLPVKMFAGEIVAMCTDAIYEAEPPS